MTLQDIVAFCNQLEQVDVSASASQTVRDLAAVVYTVTHSSVQSQDLAQQLDAKFREIHQNLHQFDDIIKTLHHNLMAVIAANDPRCIQEDQERYEREINLDTPESITKRCVAVTDQALENITARIKLLSSWQWPGMIFRPTGDEWMQPMVTLDPLYLVDHYEKIFTPFMSQYNELYQRRLRPYVITDPGTESALHKLPNNQFGFVLAYNFFNYKPLPLVISYVVELFEKLRPGGSLIMTFNDCDIAQNMGLAEKRFMMYQPWRLLEPAARTAGFEIVSVNRQGGDMVWCELRKPGDIASIRGSQALAKIVVL